MEDQRIVCVATRFGRFTGKLAVKDVHVDSNSELSSDELGSKDAVPMILHDAVEQLLLPAQNGILIHGMIHGDIVIDVDEMVVINLDTKSPLYENYFKVISNIAVVRPNEAKSYM